MARIWFPREPARGNENFRRTASPKPAVLNRSARAMSFVSEASRSTNLFTASGEPLGVSQAAILSIRAMVAVFLRLAARTNGCIGCYHRASHAIDGRRRDHGHSAPSLSHADGGSNHRDYRREGGRPEERHLQ